MTPEDVNALVAELERRDEVEAELKHERDEALARLAKYEHLIRAALKALGIQ